MSLKGYLIEKFDNMATAYTCRRLVEEAVAMNIGLKMVGARDCIAAPGARVLNRRDELTQRDFVINRYKDGVVVEAVNSLATRGFNRMDIFKRYVNKFRQLCDLRSEYFSVPGYIMGSGDTDFDLIAGSVGLPFVMKGLESSMGREIFLINDKMEYDRVRQSAALSKEWLFEEYIVESRGRDMRLFAIGGEAVAAMCRRSTDDFRANVALGAGVTNVPLDQTLRSIAGDVSETTGLDFVGIDLLFGREGYYLCEINVMPGLEGIETASGINIAHRIMAHIEKQCRS